MTPAPKRRWFRFTLRTLLIVATLWGCFFGWLGYQISWIRQRRAAIDWMAIQAEYWHEMPVDRARTLEQTRRGAFDFWVSKDSPTLA